MARPIDPTLLERHWVHSHEEDTADTMVFRPADYEFPPSRGRSGFALAAGGAAAVYEPGATDRSVKSDGRWQLEADGRLVLTPGAKGRRRELAVESVSDDKLVVKKAT